MFSPRFVQLAVVITAVAVAPIAATGPATAADARLTITGVTVEPDTPTAGAPITASSTVQLSAGSDTQFEIDSIRVRRAEDSAFEERLLANATNLGTISPGESLTVPVTFTVDDTAVHDFEVVAIGTDSDGETVRVTRPLTLGVEQGSPQVELQLTDLVAGADRPIEAVVSNPTTAQMRGIEVRVTDPSTGERVRRTIPALAAGTSETLNLSVRAASPGKTNLTVATTYTDPTGTERTASFARPVEVEPLSVDIGIRASAATTQDSQQVPNGIGSVLGGGGGSSALQSQDESDGSSTDASRADVTVTNFGNAPVEDVVVTGETPDGTVLGSVGRFRLTETLEPGESTTVTVDLSQVQTADDLSFVTSYDTPNSREKSAVTYEYAAKQGNATVTGVDVTVTDDSQIAITGSLANTGDGEITSVVVTVRPTTHVSPAYPQRTYFVGTVAASEFAPFDLTATADMTNATAVMVGVEYTSGGERVVQTTQVPLPSDADSDGQAGIAGSTTTVLVLAVGLIVTVAVIFGRRVLRQ